MRVDRDKKVAITQIPPSDPTKQNEYGEPDPAATQIVVQNVWASISPIFGKEYFQAEEVQSKTTTKIELDYFAGITRSMTVVYGSRTFEILSVIDIKEMHRTLQLMCKEIDP
jgi:SPP1 family predicted phage head-tail adaptor